jgi:hypothetical protein
VNAAEGMNDCGRGSHSGDAHIKWHRKRGEQSTPKDFALLLVYVFQPWQQLHGLFLRQECRAKVNTAGVNNNN